MFSIVKNYKIFFSITIIFLLIGFGSIVTRGFNLGIDFTGGSIVDLTFENPVSVAQVRDVLKEHDMAIVSSNWKTVMAKLKPTVY